MPQLDGAKFGSEVVLLVREFVAKSLGTFGEQIKAFGNRIEALEARAAVPGPAGERGEKGDSGSFGEPGARGENGRDGIDGKDGAAGRDGQDADEERIIGAVLVKMPELLAQIVEQAAKPKDGKDGERGNDGINGKDGRDALMLDPLPAVDPERRYARNTYAKHAGGLIRAFRDTDHIDLAQIERSGWECVLEGIAEESEEVLDGGRKIVRMTRYTSGKVFPREFRTSAWVDRQVWKDGNYEPGDVVTWGGSSFVCQRETTEKPDPLNTSGTWRLIAKKGRDGKDKA